MRNNWNDQMALFFFLCAIAIIITYVKDAFGSITPKQFEMVEIIKQTVGNPSMQDVYIAMARQESGLSSDAIGPGGEIGLFQFKLSTARLIGCAETKKELRNPIVNTKCAIKYFTPLMAEFVTVERALYAYNGGPGLARNHMFKGNWLSDRGCNDPLKKRAKCHVLKVLKFMYKGDI